MNAIRSLFGRLTVVFAANHLPFDDRYAHTHARFDDYRMQPRVQPRMQPHYAPRGESMDQSVF
ncbi:hypothetical protein [Pararobbsia silviterrae]|nr:hypothetical protein [Pararobbsia silviterrae]